MKRNRSTKILFPIFAGYEVRLIVTRDIIATARRLKEPDLIGAHAGYATRDDTPGVGWLVLQPDAGPDLVSHEASHAIRALAKFLGTEFDEETFAYHLGFLVGRIHRFLKRG
jgi:hypothetical protein